MSERHQDLGNTADGEGGIYTVRGSGTWRSWNGIRYKSGMSSRNVGSQQLSINVATIPRAAWRTLIFTWASRSCSTY